MQVNILGLEQIGAWLEQENELVAADFPELADIGENLAPVKVKVKVTRTQSGFLVIGGAETTIDLTCTRCLESFSYQLKADFTEEFFTKDTVETQPDELMFGEQVSTYVGDYLELNSLITESLVVSFPMKVLCQHDCLGLCPNCGQNFNVRTCQCVIVQTDPRLAPLADLFKDNSTREGDK